MSTESYNTDVRTLLAKEFEKRNGANRRYSVRAFARDLEISPGALSEAMSGKRNLSKKNLLKVADNLSLKAAVVNRLLNLHGFNADPDAERLEFHDAPDKLMSVIAEWQYLAILNLARLQNAVKTNDVAQRLGLAPDSAAHAVATLTQLGLISVDAGGFMKRTSRSLMTPTDVPSKVRRDYFRQHLALSERTLDHVPVDERDFSVVTVPADPKMLPETKKVLETFRRKMARLLEAGKPSKVYAVAIQVYPISDIGNPNA